MAEQLKRSSKPRPLEGMRARDGAAIIAAPSTAMLLAGFGADVIKVEHPRGDPQYQAMQSIATVEDGELDPSKMQKLLFRMSATRAKFAIPAHVWDGISIRCCARFSASPMNDCRHFTIPE